MGDHSIPGVVVLRVVEMCLGAELFPTSDRDGALDIGSGKQVPFDAASDTCSHAACVA